MSLTTATVLKYVFDAATGISLNIISTKLLEKFQQDLFLVISKLILDEHRKFKHDFPDATYPLKTNELRPAVQQHFNQLACEPSLSLFAGSKQTSYLGHFYRSIINPALQFMNPATAHYSLYLVHKHEVA